MGGVFRKPSAPKSVEAVSEAPQVAAGASDEASLSEFSDEDGIKKKKAKDTKGNSSLTIPLGNSGGSSTIGTA